MGLWQTDVEGHATWCHTGFFGTLATYVPDLDLVVAVTVNQNHARDTLVGLAHDAIAAVAAVQTEQ